MPSYFHPQVYEWLFKEMGHLRSTDGSQHEPNKNPGPLHDRTNYANGPYPRPKQTTKLPYRIRLSCSTLTDNFFPTPRDIGDSMDIRKKGGLLALSVCWSSMGWWGSTACCCGFSDMCSDRARCSGHRNISTWVAGYTQGSA